MDFLVAAGALDLRRGPQRPAVVASGKAIPHASCSGASRDSSSAIQGCKTLCGVGDRTLGFLSSADMDLRVFLESPQGSQSSSLVWACACAFLPSCSSSVPLPFAWNKGSVAFLRGFPTKLSHGAFSQGCHVPP